MVGEEFLTIKVWTDRQELFKEFQDWVLIGFNRLFRCKKHFYAGHNEEHAEEDDDPVVLDQNRAHCDENAAEDQGSENAIKEHPVLVFTRDIEIGENQHEHEDVIHRQSLLDDVACKKLQRALLGGLKRVESRNCQEPFAVLQAVDREFMEREAMSTLVNLISMEVGREDDVTLISSMANVTAIWPLVSFLVFTLAKQDFFLKKFPRYCVINPFREINLKFQ